MVIVSSTLTTEYGKTEFESESKRGIYIEIMTGNDNFICIPDGYSIGIDADGRKIMIREDTGEISPARLFFGTHDSSMVTPITIEKLMDEKRIEKERIKRYEEHLRRIEYVKNIHDALGDFVWMIEDGFKDLTPQTTTRLLYLSTYLTYDGERRCGGKRKNLLMKNKRDGLYTRDLPKLLNVSKKTADRFWREVSPEYMYENSEGIHLTDKNTIVKGSFKRYADTEYFRGYIEGIRALYKSADKGDHKRLGYIFKLLPFVNKEYNILCSNPYEDNKEKIVPLTLNEIAEYFGINKNYVAEYFKELGSIEFETNLGRMPFISAMHSFKDSRNFGNWKVIVNPCVLYRGSDYHRVEGFEFAF